MSRLIFSKNNNKIIECRLLLFLGVLKVKVVFYVWSVFIYKKNAIQITPIVRDYFRLEELWELETIVSSAIAYDKKCPNRFLLLPSAFSHLLQDEQKQFFS